MTPEPEPPYSPHWERGDRCHRYWIGPATRAGFVGLPYRTAKVHGYVWTLDFPVQGTASGHTTTLRAAKRAVERALAATRAEMRRRTYRLREGR
jgi:hypothetical protein